jgi:hypothetical protein
MLLVIVYMSKRILLIFRVYVVGSYCCWLCTHRPVEDKGCFGACSTPDDSSAGRNLLEASGMHTHPVLSV